MTRLWAIGFHGSLRDDSMQGGVFRRRNRGYPDLAFLRLGQFESQLIDFLVQCQSRVGFGQCNRPLILFRGDLALQWKFRFRIQPDGDREWFRVVSIVKFVVALLFGESASLRGSALPVTRTRP